MTRFSRSAPEVASVHSRSARPPYRSSTIAARVCRRSAIDPGKRWIAGGVEQSALNSAGSAAAIADGSMLPNRSSTLAGPRNACSIGYCWSNIIPTNRANGLSVRIWSACTSPVIWMGMSPSCLTPASPAQVQPAAAAETAGQDPALCLLVRPSKRAGSADLHREHGTGGVEEDALRVAAEDELADGRTPSQADHDQVGVAVLRDADQVLRGLEPADQLADVVFEPGLLQLGLECGEVLVVAGGGAIVVLAAAAMGVHDDERRAAELRLGDALVDRGLALRLGHVAHDHSSHGSSSTCATSTGPRTHGNLSQLRPTDRRCSRGGAPVDEGGSTTAHSGTLERCRCCANRPPRPTRDRCAPPSSSWPPRTTAA